jgi:ABC-type phosphate transport system substrate-binding protein
MRPPAAILLLLPVVVLALCANVLADPAPPSGFIVIVNPSNQASSLDQTFVADAFLKKITHWPNDEAIRPADLLSTSPVRRRFTAEVLRRSVEAVKGYWQQRIFSGRDVPPPELETDEDVVRYVLKYPGAIGYVSTNASLGSSKVVAVR